MIYDYFTGLGMKSTRFQGAFMSVCDDAGAGASRDTDTLLSAFLPQAASVLSPLLQTQQENSPRVSPVPRGSSGTGNPLRKPYSCFLGGLLHGGSGLWNVGGEESGLDISAPLKWGRIVQLWCQQLLGHIHKAVRMLTRNQEEWFLKDMKYISNEPFSSLFSAITIFFSLWGI